MEIGFISNHKEVNMSYEKMLKRTNGHNHDKDYQPMLFAMEGEHIESLNSIAENSKIF